jgi:hypothetical protein
VDNLIIGYRDIITGEINSDKVIHHVIGYIPLVGIISAIYNAYLGMPALIVGTASLPFTIFACVVSSDYVNFSLKNIKVGLAFTARAVIEFIGIGIILRFHEINF